MWFFLKRAGYFLYDHWRIIVPAIVLLVLVVTVYRWCNKPPKLDQEATIKAQQAIENNDRKRMVEVLAESDVKEQGIDNSIKAAEEATAAAKENYQGMSNEEIAAELERRLKQ